METDHHDEDDQIYGEGEEVQDNTSSGGSNKLVIPEDGYEWKKYGQKFIKNVRKFRSYFKCQNSNCRAKKRAEWSSSKPDELRVVYEGVHNHTDNNASSAGSASHSQQPDSSSALNPSTDANRFDLYTQVFGNQSFSKWDQKS
ncbi:WRKY transcription factor 44-like [Rosa sericea]